MSGYTSESKRYIIGGLLHESRHQDGTIRVQDGTPAWLGYDYQYHTAQWTLVKSLANEFKSLEDAVKSALHGHTGPWYYKIKPETIKVLEVTTVKTVTERIISYD